MILTNCAACAAPLAHDAPRCVRCKIRYCKTPCVEIKFTARSPGSPRRLPRHRRDTCSMAWRCNATCQHDHWRRGHKQMCKKIHRGGNAEQYHADKKYKEAVAVAVEKCAEDTKGQTCYICTQALHWKTKEGLVRMCACRGTAGFAHVSCLAEQAKILCDEAEDNNQDLDSPMDRWSQCSLCEQDYYGIVRCALGWACWKTYLGRPETDVIKRAAFTALGIGLYMSLNFKEALSVQLAQSSTLLRVGAPANCFLIMQNNLANTYAALGQEEEALSMRRDVYTGTFNLKGEESLQTIMMANNYACSLKELARLEEARALYRKWMLVSQRVLGDCDHRTLTFKKRFAQTVYEDDSATLRDLREAVTTLVETARTARRVLGGAHPVVEDTDRSLREARAVLSIRETSPGRK